MHLLAKIVLYLSKCTEKQRLKLNTYVFTLYARHYILIYERMDGFRAGGLISRYACDPNFWLFLSEV